MTSRQKDDQNFQKQLGARVKELREARGLSQSRLAELIGISRVQVSQVETGKRKLCADEVVKMARALNVDGDVLLGMIQGPEVSFGPGVPAKERLPLRINVPQKNVAKFKEVLLYILNQVGGRPHVGETVLYKLLYFIDFDFYEKYETQLIGATYLKNHYGPTPVEFQSIVDEMIRQGEIEKVSGSTYFQYPQTKYLARRPPQTELLQGHEIELIDNVLHRLGYMNASEISSYSHHDVPWLVTEDSATIEYETVFYRTPEFSMREHEENIPEGPANSEV
jgi:transcriptional regulator with XRE-family HTH domain